MTLLSGKDGTLLVNGQEPAAVTNWRLLQRNDAKTYTANDTGGWRRRVEGANDCHGQFQLVIADSDQVPVQPGQAVVLHLFLDASGENFYEVAARITTVRLAVEISESTLVPLVVTFAGNGPVVASGVLASNQIIHVEQ